MSIITAKSMSISGNYYQHNAVACLFLIHDIWCSQGKSPSLYLMLKRGRQVSFYVMSYQLDLTTFNPVESTLNSTYGVHYCKVGFMVFVRIYFYNINAGHDTILGTLPKGFRPSGELDVRNGFSNIAGHFIVFNTGVVKLLSFDGDISYGAAYFCYPAVE